MSRAPTVDFWFEFASTYSYLSVMRIEDLARERGVAVRWRPFLLGPIFGAQGWTSSPFNLYPAKGQYMWRDMARLCRARGLPFRRPALFPQNGLRAARIAVAAGDAMPEFCKAVYSAQFAEGEDISDLSVLIACLARAGLSETLLDTAQSPEIKAALRNQTEQAVSLGIFGAPSFTVAGELFWGDDRLKQALYWARTAP
ncbi:2-hydroxychromene-2-carboxylate isomerase [Shimia sp. SDUM112013]|uniref:2-hydroxychromene-2-carboxylate isomerase n=1 Tax=Shimia sp. SDUM112013 TaxID=3136160 RepID=UPI0032EEE45D